MNIFKKQIKAAAAERQTHFGRMFAFGEQMRRAMGLKIEDIHHPMFHMVWNIPGFALSMRSFPQNGWEPTIVASPTGVDVGKVGYSNTDESPPESWYYSPGGTATVFYPPESIQKEILSRIKDET